MAIKQINLLPKAYREHARKRQVTPFYVISFILSGVCLFGLYFYLNWQVKDLEAQSAEKEARKSVTVNGSETKTDTLALTQAQTQALAIKKVTVLNNLSKNDPDWNKVFTSVAGILPQDVSISTFVITGAASGGGINLKFSGDAPNTNSFASFMAYLTESKSLLSPKVEAFSYNPVNKKVTFTLSGSLPADKSSFTKSVSSSGGIK